MSDINQVVLVGRLTRLPELRHGDAGDPVCRIRLAVNGRARDQSGQQWVERPNFFDVACFGRQAETVADQLSTGWRVAVEGRLSWSEWEAADGSRRQAVSVIASRVQFIAAPRAEQDQDLGPDDQPMPVPVGAGDDDQDIPF